MARLDPLIRFRKHTVDEKRRVLAELYRMGDMLRARKDELLMQLASEQAIAETMPDPETQIFFGRYAQAVRARTDDIDEALSKLDVRIRLAQDDVREAFSDMKKIEITDRERKLREAKAEDAKNAALLDEIGIEGFRRKQAEAEAIIRTSDTDDDDGSLY